jgi:threonylcarbamoyladenosine tRNA methylthiotransferase MtaB
LKYSIITFGCRVNQADSLKLEEDLRARGAVEAPASDADLVIVNSCSVTATADQGTRQTVRRIARDNPRARIVVTGCYATRSPADVAALPGVARVVPNEAKLRAVALVAGACGAPLEPGMAGRTAFTLRVQTGCEERCAYCIIPATRGAGCSLPIPLIAAEVERIGAAGFKEIALAGVHLGSYGRDLQPRRTLLELLRTLAGARADVSFRISSLEPMDCTPGIVDLVASDGARFAPHFHLPLQHGSDAILERMRRPYTLDGYRRLVDGIVERLPHASIGTDVIVGFPGERDADFDRTCRYLSQAPLSHLHVFPYSDRPGTAASMMAGKVPGPVVRERGAAVRRIGAELSRRFQDAQVGTVRPGLTLDDGTLVVTDNYLKLRIGPGRARNERVLVRVTGQGAGEVLSASSR